MRISIFGLGYVGCVTAACLAREGNQVIGVDVNPDKVAALNAGQSPIIEPGLRETIEAQVAVGRLKATVDHLEAVNASEISLVCVGTPSSEVGALDLQFVRRVCEQIGTAMGHKPQRHLVVLRSTFLPGTTEEVVIPLLEKFSGKRGGKDFGVCYNPEFLREGSALKDFYDPPRTVIGESDTASGDKLTNLYASIPAPLARTEIRTAEMVKYADNAFHALKVSFANEIGNLCKAMGVDSHKVMDIFVLDTKLNLAPIYLKPGYAFGGSCLPKDLRALTHKAKQADIDAPLLRAVLKSNERQKQVGFEMIQRTGQKKIGVLGLSFKHDTDDLRESPAVELVEKLVGKGYEVMVYDRNVTLSALMGSNLAYIQRELPHLSKLLRSDLEEVLDHAEVLVITNFDSSFIQIMDRLRPDQLVLDFIRISRDQLNPNPQYHGICW